MNTSDRKLPLSDLIITGWPDRKDTFLSSFNHYLVLTLFVHVLVHSVTSRLNLLCATMSSCCCVSVLDTFLFIIAARMRRLLEHKKNKKLNVSSYSAVKSVVNHLEKSSCPLCSDQSGICISQAPPWLLLYIQNVVLLHWSCVHAEKTWTENVTLLYFLWWIQTLSVLHSIKFKFFSYQID